MATENRFTRITVSVDDDDDDIVIQAGEPASASTAPDGEVLEEEPPALEEEPAPEEEPGRWDAPAPGEGPSSAEDPAEDPAGGDDAAQADGDARGLGGAAGRASRPGGDAPVNTLEDLEGSKMGGVQKVIIAVAVIGLVAFAVYYMFFM